mmetsp:Transcript_15945/g.42961  ORF Transcript_15945/g.42961 Transcript_15945/m.42961 type:complete len:353 (+) Transcript_15945:1-1059(+)
MEYVPGVKISKAEEIEKLGIDRAQTATYCAEMYLIQLLRYGFFHCDPHPGNVAVEAAGPGPNPQPRIILYDYGMMGTLSPQLKAGLVKGFFAVYEKQADQLAEALFEAELMGEDTDKQAVESVARYFISSFSKRFAMNTKTAPATKEEREKMRVTAMQSIGQELAAIGGEKPFRYPEAFPFIIRAFTCLEGIGKSLDKDYDVYRISRRYLTELVDLKDGSALLTAVKGIQARLNLRNEDIAGLVTFPRKITTMKKFQTRLETGEIKLRVRALEVERAMFRSNLLSRACMYGIFACLAMNTVVISFLVMGRALGVLQVLGGAAAYCTIRACICLAKLRAVIRDEKNRYYNSYY